MAGMPVPLKIANNIHSTYTIYKNLDDKEDNDSWYVSYIKSLLGNSKDEREENLYVIADKDETITLNNETSTKIKL